MYNVQQELLIHFTSDVQDIQLTRFPQSTTTESTFLSTNRVKSIDEAFHSRIHVTVNYPSLSTEAKQHI
ncbi:hypothetical protein G647_08551 [Cladophialophora carrionii CBS 160.54]|uniref:Uncharacterized protein n=1 Tax=Cladophialophora carrionii CBS 160.54 TaxID=1279043 RepID=V9D0R0_9EURO|nr:uncharacterized protein G647_08551 [Cladophialophora carrionii CBS 160.54]ETI20514.1 hypothetical protein G647_08551 [Cladophialophora carrionii CBS 160.54]